MRERNTLSLKHVPAQDKRKKELQPVTLRRPSEDIATARLPADEKGIGCHAYVKLLLDEVLQFFTRKPISTPQTPEGS